MKHYEENDIMKKKNFLRIFKKIYLKSNNI